jgi:hypothetical protein
MTRRLGRFWRHFDDMLKLNPLLAGLLCLNVAVTAPAGVVINEIHFDPVDKTSAEEFIELYNSGVAPVNLGGAYFDAGISFTFPPGTTIAPGAFLIVAQNPTTVQVRFGATALGPWTGNLSSDGEKITLKNAAGGTEDEVEYGLGFPWPTVGEAPGYSIELIHPSFDNNLAGNWRRSVNAAAPPSGTMLISSNSTWRYFKGTSEASSPTTVWRASGFNDSSWLTGAGAIGFGETFIATPLNDMPGSYTTVFLRKTFQVTNAAAIAALTLHAQYDDGFKVWINGSNVANVNISSAEVPYNGTATTGSREAHTYDAFSLPSPQSYLVNGTNIIAIQVANASSGSTDFFFDARLATTSSTNAAGPTPGAINAVFAANAPPQIRQLNHSPNEPAGNQPITVTAKITDPQGVNAVALQYQIVTPGNYIELTDAAYTNAANWITLAMSDAGSNGDALAGDSIYTAVIPAVVQQHRRLIRYRLSAADGVGSSVTVPYADDPQPNFAYFCYNGVPAWLGAVQPGVTAPLNFDTNTMRRLPSVHLIAKTNSVADATWFSLYGGDLYLWAGTLVYDGKVYDHIHYRARGGWTRYAMVKNPWKFDFNRGHDLQMRDDHGKKLKSKWTKLNLRACIQQEWFQHRGEQGMFESVGTRLFQLAGVESFSTTFLQFRVIDGAAEAGVDQYEGDFWGLYLGIEQEDRRFLEEHGLPDGNFYKMENDMGELSNLGPLGPTDKSDLNYLLNNYTGASDDWWRTNWALTNYYSYQTIVQAIHHYDINGGKNFAYYRYPDSGLWKVIPWDLDLTWAHNMWLSDWGGLNNLASRILQATNEVGTGLQAGTSNLKLTGARPVFEMEFRNRVREVRDLLFNTNQAWQLIDEYAGLVRGSTNGPTFLDADRCMWDYNPKMTNSTYTQHTWQAGHGKFYQWPNEPTVSKDFNGCIQLMKNYVVVRSEHLDSLATDPAIPATPTVTYTGPTNYPLVPLTFQCSAYSGANPFAAVQWRVGEVWDTNAPAYDPTEWRPYEIAAQWESAEISPFVSSITIPGDALKVGHTYRVRARMKDNTGRWSHWSAPVQFIVTAPGASAAMLAYLRVSEVMFNPVAGSDYEFIELHNSSTNQTLDLGGAAFTAGVNYNIPAGTTLAPSGYLLVIPTTNATAFRAQYGLGTNVPIMGAYSSKLDNAGEAVTLKTAPGGTEISSFTYQDSRHWPLAADGGGHSLVPVNTAMPGQATGALDYPGNWRASAFTGGSPGQADSAPPGPTVLLNEITVHTDYTNAARPEYDSDDWIELVNVTATNINLGGWYLSDDPAQPDLWAIPAVNLPAGGRVVFSEVGGFHDPITTGFGLDKAGEQVLLSHLPGGAGNRVVDAIGFSGQENDRSLSRHTDGGDWWYVTLRTTNGPNTAPLPGLRISEFMYQPPSLGTNDNTRDEFIEIYNPTATNITLQSPAGNWRLDGGIAYTFPMNTVLPAGQALLVVSFPPTDSASSNAFRLAYGVTNSLRLFGPYTGKLGNRSDVISLEKPQEPDVVGAVYSWVLEDEVVYGNQSPWPSAVAGSGSALKRISVTQHGSDPANWSAAPPTPGSQPQQIATNAPQLVAQVSATQLQLTWPATHTGWRLETQTNSLTIGLGTNWSVVANSTQTNQMSVPVNPTNGAVFFRLVSP